MDRKKCINCGKCTEVCYSNALNIFGRYITVEEVFDVTRRDEDFYEESGGVVTIGGGGTYVPTPIYIRPIKKM